MGGVLQYKTHGQIEKERCPGQPQNESAFGGEDNNQMSPLTPDVVAKIKIRIQNVQGP